jgi:hypothetical protein
MVVITATITAHDGTNLWMVCTSILDPGSRPLVTLLAKTVTDHALSARERFGGLKQQTNKLFSRPSGEVSVPPIQQDGRCN